MNTIIPTGSAWFGPDEEVLTKEQQQNATKLGPPEKACKITYNSETKSWDRADITVQLAKGPFTRGYTRFVYRIRVLEENGVKDCVAKTFDETTLHPMLGPVTRQMFFDEAMSLIVAAEYAKMFNKRQPPQAISFLPTYLVEFTERKGRPLCSVEPILEGEFVKFNNNEGGVFSSNPTPQSFSHFTYEASNHEMLVCDIQGTHNVYTDPQIHSVNKEGFGLGNSGIIGINKFLESHTCDVVCGAVGLPRLKNGKHIQGWIKQELEAGLREYRKMHPISSNGGTPVSVDTEDTQLYRPAVADWPAQGAIWQENSYQHQHFIMNGTNKVVAVSSPSLFAPQPSPRIMKPLEREDSRDNISVGRTVSILSISDTAPSLSQGLVPERDNDLVAAAAGIAITSANVVTSNNNNNNNNNNNVGGSNTIAADAFASQIAELRGEVSRLKLEVATKDELLKLLREQLQEVQKSSEKMRLDHVLELDALRNAKDVLAVGGDKTLRALEKGLLMESKFTELEIKLEMAQKELLDTHKKLAEQRINYTNDLSEARDEISRLKVLVGGREGRMEKEWKEQRDKDAREREERSIRERDEREKRERIERERIERERIERIERERIERERIERERELRELREREEREIIERDIREKERQEKEERERREREERERKENEQREREERELKEREEREIARKAREAELWREEEKILRQSIERRIKEQEAMAKEREMAERDLIERAAERERLRLKRELRASMDEASSMSPMTTTTTTTAPNTAGDVVAVASKWGWKRDEEEQREMERAKTADLLRERAEARSKVGGGGSSSTGLIMTTAPPPSYSPDYIERVPPRTWKDQLDLDPVHASTTSSSSPLPIHPALVSSSSPYQQPPLHPALTSPPSTTTTSSSYFTSAASKSYSNSAVFHSNTMRGVSPMSSPRMAHSSSSRGEDTHSIINNSNNQSNYSSLSHSTSSFLRASSNSRMLPGDDPNLASSPFVAKYMSASYANDGSGSTTTTTTTTSSNLRHSFDHVSSPYVPNEQGAPADKTDEELARKGRGTFC